MALAVDPLDGPVWRRSPLIGCSCFRFEDGAVVFNPVSWETQLLNEAAARLLDALAPGPMTTAGLTALFRTAPAPFSREQVLAALGDMEAPGLVERIDDRS
jgi:PqqD family protein of HPr-rel-A system